MNRFKLRLWDPVLNKGAIWTYWEGALSRHRPGRGRHDGHPDAGKARLVLEHSAARQHRQRRRRRAVRLPVQGPQGNHEQTYQEEVENDARRSRNASRTRSASPATSRPSDYSYRSTRVAGDGWVLVGDAFGFLDPLYSSGVLLALKSGELAADAIVEGLTKGDTSAAQLGRVGRRRSTRASIACAGWSASITTASASASSSSNYPHLRGTVTDLLIGDLFTDEVDKVWGPMESLYPPDKQAIAAVEAERLRRRQRAQGQRADAAGGTPAIDGVARRPLSAGGVEFAETDAAGIVHFSVFFRYMEEAEHAVWRQAGLDIVEVRRRTELAAHRREVRLQGAAQVPGRIRDRDRDRRRDAQHHSMGARAHAR